MSQHKYPNNPLFWICAARREETISSEEERLLGDYWEGFMEEVPFVTGIE